MTNFIDPATLLEQLLDGDELAVLDAREQGVFFRSHLFHAACVALSSLELELPVLVPRRNTRIVWCDSGESDLAIRAARKSVELGYTHVSVLSGGTAAWREADGELYEGVNVASKAFGEFVEQTYHTPHIAACELHRLIEDQADIAILDSRPMAEFGRMSIPTGLDCPGAELVHRVKEVAPAPETLVVVNCAGRTRSIIGAQSLINAGLENKVVALENGTMGWELAGLELATDQNTHAPSPSETAQSWSQHAAAGVATRFGVRSIDNSELARWLEDPDRTTYLLDVRTPEEFVDGHIAGSISAPGGQLIQATDEYVATHNARIVLIDDDGVRAIMTASWLQQLGWGDAVVLEGGVGGRQLVSGKNPRPTAPRAPSISNTALAERLAANPTSVAVLDIGTSLKFRQKGHIPGAWWGVRSRLDQARDAIGEVAMLVLTSTDGQLAKLAVAEAAELWPNSDVVALTGGNKSWRHAGLDMEPGFERATTTADDVWYKPYDHDGEVVKQHMRDYITWEIALVEQLERDPTVRFETY